MSASRDKTQIALHNVIMFYAVVQHDCFVLGQVPANHLISASVMSAPAALAMSKLRYPETEVSRTTADLVTIEKRL